MVVIVDHLHLFIAGNNDRMVKVIQFIAVNQLVQFYCSTTVCNRITLNVRALSMVLWLVGVECILTFQNLERTPMSIGVQEIDSGIQGNCYRFRGIMKQNVINISQALIFTLFQLTTTVLVVHNY